MSLIEWKLTLVRKLPLSEVTAPKPWLATVKPATVTVSVPTCREMNQMGVIRIVKTESLTVPLAVLPSSYWMENLDKRRLSDDTSDNGNDLNERSLGAPEGCTR